MSPLALTMLVDIGTLAQPVIADYPAQREILQEFVAAQMVQMVNGVPMLLPRGRAHLHFLCQLPLPVAIWSIPSASLEIAQEALQ